jgi:hypothetical protein
MMESWEPKVLAKRRSHTIPADPAPSYGTQGACPHCGQRFDIGALLEGSMNRGLDVLDEIPKQVWWAIAIHGFVWPVIKWTFLLIVAPTLVVLGFHFLGI